MHVHVRKTKIIPCVLSPDSEIVMLTSQCEGQPLHHSLSSLISTMM